MKKFFIITATFVLIGVVAIPVMARGPRWSKGDMMHGMGYGPRSCPNYGSGYDALTPEERDQLDIVHKKFNDETNQLRNNLRTKQSELRDTLNVTEPDAERAKAIQREISDIRAQLAQKRVELTLEERKINPKLGHWQGNHGREDGHHRWAEGGGPGHGWNRGGFGPGYCR